MRNLLIAVILTHWTFSSLASGTFTEAGAAELSPHVCNVMDFGARGDGKTVDTKAIQATIDACVPGGVVVIPSGKTFLSGMIQLKSHLTFRIEPGARLKGTQNDEDYPELFPKTVNTQLNSCHRALIYADSVEDVTIEGNVNSPQDLKLDGVVDGSGDDNRNWNGPERTRPMAIFVVLSKRIKIRDLQVVNSGMWSVVNFETDDVLIDHVRVDSHAGPTRDGLDIVDGDRVLIQNVDINSEDDSICLKSGSAKGVHHVVVRNAIIRNSLVANALKLGTASTGAFQSILFENIQIEATRQAAMAVESVDGAKIENVVFRNIKFKNVGTPFFMVLGLRLKSMGVGSIDDVEFQNIEGSTNLNWGSALSGSVVDGKTSKPTNIKLSNVHITNQNLEGLKSVPQEPGEYVGQYPDPRMWPVLAAYGLFIRHIENLSLHDVSIQAAGGDPRREIVAVDSVIDKSF